MEEVVINITEENDVVTFEVTEVTESVTIIISEAFVGDLVRGEILTGAVNGQNATYTTQNNFRPESVEVYINGIKAINLIDYTTQGSNTINFIVSPEAGDQLTINYLKS